MKKRPSLTLREPVKLYEDKEQKPPILQIEEIIETPKMNEPQAKETPEVIVKEQVNETTRKDIDSVKNKMSPRIRQIWEYFCQKAISDGEIKKSFSLTRTEVMKEAGIGSTNTYRDALKKFQELNLIEIELRPGVNSGSIFTFTEKGIEQLN